MKNMTKTILLLCFIFALGLFVGQNFTQKQYKNTDISFKYQPKNKDELIKLIQDESIYLGDIDTSLIVDMSYLFAYFETWLLVKDQRRPRMMENMKRKNDDYRGIENWDTSNVKNMAGMFYGNSNFNEPIGSWNTSNVENMEQMFAGAYAFNQSLWNWDTSKVKNMRRMFYHAFTFNKELGHLDTSNVENMEQMFEKAYNFNQPLDETRRHYKWSVSKVKNMRRMFAQTRNFNQSLNNWNINNVENTEEMFVGAQGFYKQDFSRWDIGRIKNAKCMFDFMPVAAIDVFPKGYVKNMLSCDKEELFPIVVDSFTFDRNNFSKCHYYADMLPPIKCYK